MVQLAWTSGFLDRLRPISHLRESPDGGGMNVGVSPHEQHLGTAIRVYEDVENFDFL